MPKAQTTATAKYKKKIGLKNKTFCLQEDLINRFIAACEANEVSQNKASEELMEGFIDGRFKVKE